MRRLPGFGDNSNASGSGGDAVIRTRGLTKRYRRYEKDPGLLGSVRALFRRRYVEKEAVRAFDLDVAAGEFVGLIGPNGAGKTTLVKMLTGIIAPTAGEVSVLGHVPNRLEDAFKRQYAVVMGQKSQLFFELTARDTFQLFKALYGIPDAAFRRNVEYFAGLFDVEALLDVQVRTLSLGERMKMELVCALLHDPGVLFLDEPTIGLDAVAQRQVREFLRKVNRERGVTVLLTSHYMDDVRSCAGRCVVISGGEKVYDGGTESLFAAYETNRKVTARFAAETAFAPPEGARVLEATPFKAVFAVPAAECGRAVAQVAREYALEDVAVEEEDIGEVVERIYAAAKQNRAGGLQGATGVQGATGGLDEGCPHG